MKISRNNYEIYLVDFFDGKLNPSETAELMRFLELHPDIRSEFENFENLKFKPEKIVFTGKEQLKRNIIAEDDFITEDNYTQIFFEAVEGNLDTLAREKLQQFLKKNPSLQREYELLQKTKLKPETIIYKDKAGLKKSVMFPLHKRVMIIPAAAAVLLLLIMSIALTVNLKNEPDKALAFSNLSTVKKDLRKPVSHDIPQKSQVTELNRIKDSSVKFINKNREEYFVEAMKPLAAPLIPEPAVNTETSGLSYQNAFLNIYHAMEMRVQMKRAEENKSQQTLTRMAMNQIHKAAGNEVSPYQKTRFSLWDIAEIGVAGYNALSAKDIKVNRKFDEQGRTIVFALGNFEYSK